MSGSQSQTRGLDSRRHTGTSDKLKNRRPQGTPEKAGTPSQDAMQDEQPPSRNVIWNDEIENLQIRQQELQRVREPGPLEVERKSPVTECFSVRKMKPAAEVNKPKPRVVTVAKTAPPDAPIKPMDFSGFAGPRYDNDGHVIAHSILGSYDDFQTEAIRRGDLLDIPTMRKEDLQSPVPTLKYEKKRRRQAPETGRTHESKALHNWQLKMLERKKQQGYISNLLQTNPEDLVMNQADNFRTTQEERYIVDRSIPAVGYGKGFRVGSEFWKQQEKFGDELTGVHSEKPAWIPTYDSMTLTQTEKGYPPPIEHIGIPAKIRDEKGWRWSPTHTRPMHYPWHKAPYLEERKKSLQKYINELDPHKPEFDSLQVVGSSNPYEGDGARSESAERMLTEMDKRITEMEGEEEFVDTPDHFRTSGTGRQPTPVFGPSLQFAGQAARWTGDSTSFKDQVGIEARVNFETNSGERVTSYLTVVNNGTTSIYYDWKKCERENPFDLVQTRVQRFYFNNSSGVVLPGETMRFPFVFKSPNAGVFHEQWKFETRPLVCGGASLLVTLRGIAFAEDTFEVQRKQIEADLKQKESEQLVRHILEDILGGMRTPDRPKSPIDAYITDEEIFTRCNPKLSYQHQVVEELKQMYVDLVPPEHRDGRYWDLSIHDLKDELLDLDEDDERKETLLHQLNVAVAKMSFSPHRPVQKQLYKAGYQLLMEAVDNMVGQAMLIRQVMGIPERDDDFSDELNQPGLWNRESSATSSTTEKLDSRGMSRRASRTPGASSKTPNPKLATEDSSISEGRGKKSAVPADKGAKQPDKKGPPPAKDKDKGGKVAKELTKPDIKSGKSSATPGSRAPPSRGRASATLGDRERTSSPGSLVGSPMTHDDPIVDRKYKEKIFGQAYSIMGDCMDSMECVFDEITYSNNSRTPLQP